MNDKVKLYKLLHPDVSMLWLDAESGLILLNRPNDCFTGCQFAWSSISKFTCEFKNGLKHGKQKRYYENNMLEYEIEYYYGWLHGQEKWFYKDGKKKYECSWVEGSSVCKTIKNYTEAGITGVQHQFSQEKQEFMGVVDYD